MRILMLVNWKIQYCSEIPADKQPPDYYVENEPYWFYRYFSEEHEIDVVGMKSFKWLEHFEQFKLRFYLSQTLKVVTRLHKYDLIVSHSMQSGVAISLLRRFIKTKAKHIVFDIGSFASASEQGLALKLMQFASKSIDGIIYHTSSQRDYYQKFFPWIVEKSKFIRFGTDLQFFNPSELTGKSDKDSYIVCVGYSKRDWDTLVEAYKLLKTDVKLRLVGHVEEKYTSVRGVEQIPFVPIKEAIDQINNALFSVLPLESFNYSYGQMTLMQQMALKKCVLTARVPSLVDYIEDMKTAVLYEPKSICDLAEKMELLIRNDELRNEIGNNAADYLMNECNEQTMAIEVEKFYNKVINGGMNDE